jgi:hypothetical protein
VGCKEILSLDGVFAYDSELGFRVKFTESRADHGLENFGDSLYPHERYGRHDWTRTSDLYRVKVGLNHTYNNFRVRPETAKPR